jgi:hypothetical protein
MRIVNVRLAMADPHAVQKADRFGFLALNHLSVVQGLRMSASARMLLQRSVLGWRESVVLTRISARSISGRSPPFSCGRRGFLGNAADLLEGCHVTAHNCLHLPAGGRTAPRSTDTIRVTERSSVTTTWKVEMRFAHLKRMLRLSRLRLRGPRSVHDEFVLAAIAQNLRQLTSLVARPSAALCVL